MNLTAASTSYTSELASKSEKVAVSSDRQQVGHRFLKFRLDNHLFLLPVHQAVETITVSAHKIVPTSNMPPTMLGLVKHRGQMLWVIDLAELLGVSATNYASQFCKLVLLQFDHVLLGLRVQGIGETLTLPMEYLRPVPTRVPANLVSFLQGCFQHYDETLLVLDAKLVLKAPILRPS